jgi:hypothetical protein
MLYKSKINNEEVDATSFDEMLKHFIFFDKVNYDGYAWNFNYKGIHISQEKSDYFIVHSGDKNLYLNKDFMLIINENVASLVEREIFLVTHERI